MSASQAWGPRPRERATALAAVVLVHGLLAVLLLSGLRVSLQQRLPDVQRLISVPISSEPTVEPLEVVSVEATAPAAAAPVPEQPATPAEPVPDTPAVVPAAVTPIVSLPAAPAAAAPAGAAPGGSSGTGIGGGTGGQGSGAGAGAGSDLVHVAGAIFAADYPAHLRRAGKGGRVGILFVVGPTGRVDRCSVTASSGVPELDRLTCRLIKERFVYRPSKDASGLTLSEEVEGVHQWVMLKD